MGKQCLKRTEYKIISQQPLVRKKCEAKPTTDILKTDAH